MLYSMYHRIISIDEFCTILCVAKRNLRYGTISNTRSPSTVETSIRYPQIVCELPFWIWLCFNFVVAYSILLTNCIHHTYMLYSSQIKISDRTK